MKDHKATTLRLTDAPEVYDGFGTKTIEVVGSSKRVMSSGHPIRLVSIEDDDADWQLSRYDSGMQQYTGGNTKLSILMRLGDWHIDPQNVARLAGMGVEGVDV